MRVTVGFERLHHVQLAIPSGGEARCRAFWDPEFPGQDRFYAADPFGNRLEFLEPSA